MTSARGTDQERIDAVGRGDVRTFETLFRQHRDFVWRVARRFSGDDHLAMDVAQETFAWLHQRCLQGDFHLAGKLTTLLYPVARNMAVSMVRTTRRESDQPIPDQEVQWIDVSETDALDRLLTTLPEGQREVLLLRFVEDMSLLEIATTLDIPPGTVKSRLHTALGTLRGHPATRDLLG